MMFAVVFVHHRPVRVKLSASVLHLNHCVRRGSLPQLDDGFDAVDPKWVEEAQPPDSCTGGQTAKLETREIEERHVE
jgi:hypothetical protein